MYTIIITVLIGMVIAIYITYQSIWCEDYILNTLISVILSMPIGLLIALFVPHENETITTTYEIETIKDNNSVFGSFFIGSGQIEGKMKYVFYYKTDDAFKIKQIDYDKVSIKYSNETPKVEKYINCSKSKFSITFKNERYIVFVPQGTIKQNYTLDAQ